MQSQSTAPLSRGARRAYTMLATVSILLLGTGIGVMSYGALMEPEVLFSYRGASEPTLIPRATATPRIVRSDPTAIGAVGTFGLDVNLWVDDTGLWAYNRADANHDGRGMSAAMRLWDSFIIPAGTRAMVTNRRGGAVQFEALDGALAGKRGWRDIPDGWFRPQD